MRLRLIDLFNEGFLVWRVRLMGCDCDKGIKLCRHSVAVSAGRNSCMYISPQYGIQVVGFGAMESDVPFPREKCPRTCEENPSLHPKS